MKHASKIRQITAAILLAVFLLGGSGIVFGFLLGQKIKAYSNYMDAQEELRTALEPEAKWLEPERAGSENGKSALKYEEEGLWPVTETDVFPDWEAPDLAASDLHYEHYDYARFEEAIGLFVEALGLGEAEDIAKAELSVPPGEEETARALEALLDEYDKIGTLSAINQYQYSQDITDEAVKDEMNYMETLIPDVFNLLLDTLQAVQKNPQAGPVLDKVLGESRAEDLSESEGLTERQKAIREEENRLEQAFDSLEERSDYEEKGEIYLKLLKLRNEFAKEAGYKDYHEMDLAESYGRDFSDEELEDYFTAVKETFVPLYMALAMRVNWRTIEDYHYPEGETLESLVGNHLGHISSELLESYDYLLENDLLLLGDAPENEEVSYTIGLPSYHSALIFIRDGGDYANLSTLIHEFGHFNTAVRETGDSFFSHSNIDLAEIHSQGLELLFLPYADEMYQAAADDARNMILLNMVWAVLTGCLYHEFEIFAYTAPDPDLETLQEGYLDIAEDYLPGMNDENDWMFWHLYHAPFYYISYSLSAMASLTLLPEMRENWRGAVESYLKLCAMGEASYPFRETLERAGLADIFSLRTVREIASEISRWMQDPIVMTPGFAEGRETEGAEEGDEKESRPSISLPEYGTEAEPSDNTEAGKRQDERPEDRQEASEAPVSGKDNLFWNGRGGSGFWRKLSELPRAFVYVISGDIWADLFSRMNDLRYRSAGGI